MKAEERAQLDALEKRFTDALEARDADAMCAVLEDDSYFQLRYLHAWAEESTMSSRTYAIHLGAQIAYAANVILADRVRRNALADRVAALEAKPMMKYCGVWEPGDYAEGEVVTQGGSMWIAREPTNSRPGTDDSFQLCVKRGRSR